MMYSQQEYDMVRRQTMQIEAEKRALLRWALIAVSIMLVVSLIFTGLMFRRYNLAESIIRDAKDRAAAAENQLQQVSRELAEKKAILEKNSATLAQQNAVINSTVPKLLAKTARDPEIAELAAAVYQQPGHVIEVPGMPPDKIFRKFYRARVDGQVHKFVLVPGELEGKQVIYSLLVRNE